MQSHRQMKGIHVLQRISGILKSASMILLMYIGISRAADALVQQLLVRTYDKNVWAADRVSEDRLLEMEEMAHAYNETLYSSAGTILSQISENSLKQMTADHFVLQDFAADDDSHLTGNGDDNSHLTGNGDDNSLLTGNGDYNSLLNINGDGIMGYVEIPCLGISMPVFHDTSEDSMQRGAGHLYGTSLPVGGKNTHTVIAGHRGLPSMKAFTDLDQMKEGDVFVLHILQKDLYYQVDQIETVLPSETEALAIKPGEDYATLLTCTPYGINSHRLLVRGRRITSADLPANTPSSAFASFTSVSDAFSISSFSSISDAFSNSSVTSISKPFSVTSLTSLSDTFSFSWRFTIGLGIFSAITGVTLLLYIWKISVNSE